MLGEEIDQLAPLRGPPIRTVGGLSQNRGNHVVEAHLVPG